METTNFIKIARRMTDVNRCQGTPMNHPYSVTEHGAQAAVLYIGYCEYERVPVDAELLSFILMHDVLEVFTGDVLYPAKHLAEEAWEMIEEAVIKDTERRYGVDLRKYSDKYIKGDPEQARIWKLCDTTELWCNCADELSQGNNTIDLLNIMKVCYSIVVDEDVPYFVHILNTYNKDAMLALTLFVQQDS